MEGIPPPPKYFITCFNLLQFSLYGLCNCIRRNAMEAWIYLLAYVVENSSCAAMQSNYFLGNHLSSSGLSFVLTLKLCFVSGAVAVLIIFSGSYFIIFFRYRTKIICTFVGVKNLCTTLYTHAYLSTKFKRIQKNPKIIY